MTGGTIHSIARCAPFLALLTTTACSSQNWMDDMAVPSAPTSSVAGVTPPSVVPEAAPNHAPDNGGNYASIGRDNRRWVDTPTIAVTEFVTDVLEKNYADACALMRHKRTPLQDCLQEVTKLHDSWAKPGIPLPPHALVTVSVAIPEGKTIGISANSIRVGTRALSELAGAGTTVQAHKHPRGWRIAQVANRAPVSS